MSNQIKRNTSGAASVDVLDCSSFHLARIVRELRSKGVELKSTSGLAQTTMLEKVLEARGALGLNTFEGVAAGYVRLAARIRDLRDAGCIIDARRETLVGPDGLEHHGVARYVLVGRKKAAPAVEKGARHAGI